MLRAFLSFFLGLLSASNLYERITTRNHRGRHIGQLPALFLPQCAGVAHGL